MPHADYRLILFVNDLIMCEQNRMCKVKNIHLLNVVVVFRKKAIYRKIPIFLVKGPLQKNFPGGAYTWTNIYVLKTLNLLKQLQFFEIFCSQPVFITEFSLFLF